MLTPPGKACRMGWVLLRLPAACCIRAVLFLGGGRRGHRWEQRGSAEQGRSLAAHRQQFAGENQPSELVKTHISEVN